MIGGDTDRRRLAQLVKQQRQNLGLSVRAAAKNAGVDRATWTGLEEGSRETQDRQFAGIERALDWPPGTIDQIRRNELPAETPVSASRSQSGVDGTLGDLIAARRNQTGLTYEQLSAQATAKGHDIASRMLMRLANDNPPEYPGPATLRAVATALDLPLTDIQRAATRTAHLWPPPTYDKGVDTWLELVDELEPIEIDHVLNVVRAVVQALKSPTPATELPGTTVKRT
jgi:transcriptional regulator with XRE-family HTH domain